MFVVNCKSIANELNGLQYGVEIPSDILSKAKDNHIFIVYGHSDDLVIVEGAFSEEHDIYDDELINVAGCSIKPIYDSGYYMWRFECDSKHESFDIMENDEYFCRAIVIDLNDVDLFA